MLRIQRGYESDESDISIISHSSESKRRRGRPRKAFFEILRVKFILQISGRGVYFAGDGSRDRGRSYTVEPGEIPLRYQIRTGSQGI